MQRLEVGQFLHATNTYKHQYLQHLYLPGYSSLNVSTLLVTGI